MKRIIVLAAAALAAVAGACAHAASPRDAVRAWRQAHETAIVTDFTAFLSLPDVATTLPDVEKNADYIEAQLQARGFATKRLYAAPGTPPSVFAELKVPGAKRTVLFYAHYDGQPVVAEGLDHRAVLARRCAPPCPRPRPSTGRRRAGPLDPDWRLYARASGDDKATIQALISAFDALKAKGIKPSVNIKLLYEGEEEQGSPHFATIVSKNLDLLQADALIMGDGPMHQSGKQMVAFGNRGIVGLRR